MCVLYQGGGGGEGMLQGHEKNENHDHDCFQEIIMLFDSLFEISFKEVIKTVKFLFFLS